MNALLVALALLFAAAPASWQTKPPAQWDENDAKQILAGSPWVVDSKLLPIPPRSPDSRREGGDWDTGIGHGVGIAGTGILGHEREKLALARAHALPDPGNITIVWASALPVRAAETKLGATDVPTWGDAYYAITLLDVPIKRKLIVTQLKPVAWIRHSGGGKDIKPARVEILEQSDGFATVVYLFSRSAEITRRESSISFYAQLGELVVSQLFYPPQMVIGDQLEL
jgi:hypothetical protein